MRAVFAIISAALIAAFTCIVEQCKRLEAADRLTLFTTWHVDAIGFFNAICVIFTILFMNSAAFGGIAFAAAPGRMR